MKRALMTLATVCALLVVGSLARRFVAEDSAPGDPRAAGSPAPGENGGALPGKVTAPGSAASAQAVPPPSFAGAKFEAPAGVSARFSGYLGAEAKLMDSNRVDTAAAEERAKAEGAQMGAPEIRYARDLALSPKAPGNLRVAAAYSLTKAPWPLNRDALSSLINVGGNSGRAEPHTVEEVQNTQAKAFALMAVDRLAEEAVHDAGARGELERQGREVRDPTVQKYILTKLRELPPLR